MKENMKNDALLRGGPAGWEKIEFPLPGD